MSEVRILIFKPMALWRDWVSCPHAQQLSDGRFEVLTGMDVNVPFKIEQCSICSKAKVKRGRARNNQR